MPTNLKDRQAGSRETPSTALVHRHRTAKIIELVAASPESFEDAVRVGLEDANQTIRGITGCHVENFSVKCADGKIKEYKVNLKVSFGIERTTESNGAKP